MFYPLETPAMVAMNGGAFQAGWNRADGFGQLVRFGLFGVTLGQRE
jgi:hypothetical protein